MNIYNNYNESGQQCNYGDIRIFLFSRVVCFFLKKTGVLLFKHPKMMRPIKRKIL
jgi:hypothetical protein